MTLLAFSLCMGSLAQPVTGLLYFVIEDLDNGRIVQRGIAGSQGIAFDQVLLSPNTRHRAWILEAATLRIGRAVFTSPNAGRSLEAPDFLMLERATHDADQDGLPDLAEFILGTDGFNPDSDDDGQPDGAEVLGGSNPASGLATRIDIIDGVGISGGVQDVTAYNDLAIVARGNQGFQIFNIFNRMSPVLVADVPTTGNSGAPNHVDCTGNLLATAVGLRGVTVYDVSDPPSTQIVQLIPNIGFVQRVTTAGRYVYAANFDRDIILADMITGAVLDRRSYPGPAIADLAVAGDYLYTLQVRMPVFPDPGVQIIYKIAMSTNLGDPVAALMVSNATHVALGPTHLHAGGGLIYVGGVGESVAGRITPGIYIVRDEGATLSLLGPPPSPLTTFDVALNGSGRAVFTQGYRTSGNAAVGFSRLGVADVTDPEAAAQFITSFEHLTFPPLTSPTLPKSVVIYNGLAYGVTDGIAGILVGGGLHVANYMPLDTLRRPPTVSLITSSGNGQIVEGSQIRVTAVATDDVQVRNVEFYLDGARIATDGGFPFEYRFDAPSFGPATNFMLRARASDTGGNAAFSEPVVIQILAFDGGS